MAGKTSPALTVEEAKNRLRNVGKQREVFPAIAGLCRRAASGKLSLTGMAGMAMVMGMAMGFSAKLRNKIFSQMLKMFQE